MKIFRLLTCLIVIDIALTFICVGFLGARELNMLCCNFPDFIAIKFAVSLVGLGVLSRMRSYQGWRFCAGVLVVSYGIIFLFNLTSIADSFV